MHCRGDILCRSVVAWLERVPLFVMQLMLTACDRSCLHTQACGASLAGGGTAHTAHGNTLEGTKAGCALPAGGCVAGCAQKQQQFYERALIIWVNRCLLTYMGQQASQT